MINTTHKKAVTAYNAICKIQEKPFHFKDARNIMYLMMELQKEADFHTQELQKLLRRYNPKNMNGGTVQFETVEERDAFDNAYLEMDNMEISVDADVVQIDLNLYSDDSFDISPKVLMDLQGFVEIVDNKPEN